MTSSSKAIEIGVVMNMASRAAARGPRWRAWIIAALRVRLSECRMARPDLGRTPD
jgi:hypothetical protein